MSNESAKMRFEETYKAWHRSLNDQDVGYDERETLFASYANARDLWLAVCETEKLVQDHANSVKTREQKLSPAFWRVPQA